MKIRTSLQASVHLTTDECKTLESAVDLLIDMSTVLENLMDDFEGPTPENIITMNDDVRTAFHCLEKILSNIEK